MSEWRAGRTIRAPRSSAARRAISIPACPTASARWRGAATRSSARSRAGRSSRSSALGGHSPSRRRDARVRAARDRSAVGRWSRRVGRRSSRRSSSAIAAGLDDEVQRRLQEAGTYHVIAISGGNIAILAGLMLVVFRLAGLLGRGAMLTRDRGARRLRLAGRRRRVGRSRDADGGRLLRWARARSARPAAERAGARGAACCWWPIRCRSSIRRFSSPSARPRRSWW